jgi:multiple sugar transport system substrate-binding protein
MRGHRLLLARFASLLTALLIAACSSGSSPAPSTLDRQEDHEPVTITWSFWGDDWETAVNERVARAFERDHSGIRIQTVQRPWSQYFAWLREEWAEGRSPDVMFLNYIPSYVATGELEPIERFIEREPDAIADIYPALLASFRSRGRLYGIPRDNDTKVIYYNRAHFAEAGIPEPHDGWTWQDLRRAAIALTQPDADRPRYGFGFEPSYWWLIWLWQGGGGVLDDPFNPRTVLLDSPANAASLQFLQDLIYRDGVTPPPQALTTDAMNALFRAGRLSMVFGNHTLVPWFANEPDLAWDVAPLPQGVERVNVAGGAGFVISRRSQHQEAAWALVRYLTGPKAQAMLSDSGVIVPARRSVREDNIFIRQRPYRADIFLSETEIGRPVPSFAGGTAREQRIDQSLIPLWRGEQSAAEVLHQLQPRVEELTRLDGS